MSRTIAQCRLCRYKLDITGRSNPEKCPECGGPMETYVSSQLSPEELARYRAMPKPGKPRSQDGVVIRPATMLKSKSKEVTTMNTAPVDGIAVKTVAPNKTEFLKEIAKGKSISKVERDWSMPKGALQYWVRKWGLKGIRQSRAQQLLDEMKIDCGDPSPESPAPSLSQVNDELLKQKDAEIARIRTELEHAKKSIWELVEEKALRNKTEESGYVTIRLPILPVSAANAERRRIYDAIDAVSGGFEASEIDRERVMRELFELMQRVVSFITADLAELLPRQDVSEHVQTFFRIHNEKHNVKIVKQHETAAGA